MLVDSAVACFWKSIEFLSFPLSAKVISAIAEFPKEAVLSNIYLV